MTTATQKKTKKVTVEHAINEYELWLRAVASAPKTIVNHVTTCWAWARYRKLDNTSIASVSEKHIGAWINDPGSPNKAQTRAVNLAALRGLFRFTTSKGWTVGNPAALVQVDLRALSHEQKEVGIRQPFTLDEVKRIIAFLEKKAASDQVRGNEIFWIFAVRIAAEMGWRLGDICELEWTCFQSPGKLTVWTSKKNKRLELPISNEIQQLVSEVPVLDGKYLFPEQREIHTSPELRSGLPVQFGRILQAVGIEGKSFHCLRHMAATQKYAKADKEALAKKLAQALTMEQIAALLGHSETKVTKGYVHELP
jgi:integrase